MSVPPTLKASLSGRYRLERELGRGGSAAVYLARDLRHDRPVALKVIHREISATIAMDRFLREIRIAASLQHPNILPLLDSGEADGLPYFATPYVEGASLREYLAERGRLPFAEVARIAREVAAGLSYAHANGVLHRDVKPGNILLSDGHAILADFGLAKAVSSATDPGISDSGGVGGTVHYMSPEQAHGGVDLDGRSDQYSLACVVYEMLTGEPPFTGRSTLAVVARQLSGTVESLRVTRPTVSARTDEAVCRALDKESDRRFPSVSEFADALTAGLQATPEPMMRRGMWIRRAVAAFITLVAVVAGIVLFRGGAPPPLDEGSVIVFPLLDARGVTGEEGAGEQVAIMIGATLDHAEPLRWIDGWDWLDPETRSDMSSWTIGQGLTIARERDAGYVIDGRIMVQEDSVIVLLRLHRASDGRLAQRSLASAASGTVPLPELGRRAAVSLLPAIIDLDTPVPADVLTGFAPTSVVRWLQGEREYRDSNFSAALTLFQSALATDSSMALAAMRGAQAASWSNQWHRANQLIAHALERGAGLTPRQRLLARGLLSYYTGAAAAAEEDLREALDADPDWSDAWMALGEVYYHLLPEGASGSNQAEAAFRNARSVDPGFTPPLVHLAEIALRHGDLDEANELAGEFQRTSPDGALAGHLELLTRCAGGEDIEWTDEVRRFDAAPALEAAVMLGAGGAFPECAVGAFRALYEFADENYRWSALVGLHSWYLSLGLHDHARGLIASAPERYAKQRNYLYTAGALAGAPFAEEAEVSVQRLESQPGLMSATQLWAIGAWGGSTGQVERAANALSWARERHAQSRTASDSLLVDVLDAWMTLSRADTAGAIERFERLAPVAPPTTLGWGLWEPLGAEKVMLARLRLAGGDYVEALRQAGYVDHPQPVPYVAYLAESLTIRQLAAETLGKRGDAALYRSRLDRLRQASRSVDVPPQEGDA